MQHVTHPLVGVRPAVLSGWLYIPYEAVGGREAISRLKKSLTFRPRFQNADEPTIIEMFHDWNEREYLGVPRAWGFERFRGRVPLIDRSSMGEEISVPRLPDPHHPRVRNPEQQQQFITDISDEFSRRRSFVAKASTGSGKTVVSLSVAGGVLKRKTIVMVHLERLMWQWVEEIKDKLGVPEDRIGIIQSDTCDWRDKDFCVAMMHSLVRRKYEREFYRSFGLAIYDEVHKVGTDFFNPVVHMFPTYYRLGLSATVERDDGGEKMFFNHLGPIAVTSRAPAMPMDVYPIRYKATRPLWGNNPTSRVKCLSEDRQRNLWLAGLIKRLYLAERKALIVSFSVEHLQTLMLLAEQLGVPKEAMGQFTAQRHSGRYCEIEKVEVQGGFAYLPVRDEQGRIVTNTKKTDISSAELDRVKKTAQLTFATYGMVTEGIDEPRWDAGLDATPRGKATQLIGRVRRMFPNKRRPFWLTPYDEACVFSRKMFAKRTKDYESSGATVKEIA